MLCVLISPNHLCFISIFSACWVWEPMQPINFKLIILIKDMQLCFIYMQFLLMSFTLQTVYPLIDGDNFVLRTLIILCNKCFCCHPIFRSIFHRRKWKTTIWLATSVYEDPKNVHFMCNLNHVFFFLTWKT